jgi:poly(hydroxyalkanoate) granule-associated protein
MKVTKRPLRTPRLRQSAQQVWLAGLGALALAEEQGGKLFSSLVKKGMQVEKVNKSRLEKVVTKVGEFRTEAGKAIGRINLPVDFGMSGALHRLGVPSRKEIVTLTKRVEELTKSVERAKARPHKKVHHVKPEPTPVA